MLFTLITLENHNKYINSGMGIHILWRHTMVWSDVPKGLGLRDITLENYNNKDA